MMGAFADLLGRGKPVLWLDSHAYTSRLLANNNAPWLDVSQFVAWQRKAMGLLKSDVTPLPLAPAIAAWLENHTELRAAMAAKTRAVYPIKTLLADEALRAHLVELTRGLRAGVGGVLALVLPSPRAWVALAYKQAHGETVEVGEDEADSASVFVADVLNYFGRAFGEIGIDALLLEEADDYAPASAAELTCYQPVLNVAAHYRWDVGLRIVDVGKYAGGLPPGCTFAIAPMALNNTATGIALAESFWSNDMAPATGKFCYARIPPDAQPESVLDRLATLR